jgi:hypothetical protein
MPKLMEKTARFLKNHFTRLSDFPPGAFVYIEPYDKFLLANVGIFSRQNNTDAE